MQRELDLLFLDLWQDPKNPGFSWILPKPRIEPETFTGGSHQQRLEGRERPAAVHFQCKLASMSGRRCERRVVSSDVSFANLSFGMN